MRRASEILFCFFVWLCCMPFVSTMAQTSLPAGAERTDYVSASLLIASPGPSFASCYGHAALRMQCPSQKMDYCFTYEMAESTHPFIDFISGKGRCGLLAIPTSHYLSVFEHEARGVMQYDLLLTPGEESRLWQLLDSYVEKGLYLPLDLMHHSCAQECAALVVAALDNRTLQYVHRSPTETPSLRTLGWTACPQQSWQQLSIALIVGQEGNQQPRTQEEALLTPELLKQAFRQATLVDTSGRKQPLLSASPQELLPIEAPQVAPTLGPLPIACFVLLWCIVVSLMQWRCGRNKGFYGLALCTDAALLLLHAILTLALLYLHWCSTLPGTSCNPYLLVFSPLPWLVWWLLGYGKTSVRKKSVWAAIWAGWMAAFIVWCACTSCHDYALWLLIAAMALRCAIHSHKQAKS